MNDNISNGIYKISEALGYLEVEWIDSIKLKEEKIDIYNFFNINTSGDIKKFDNIHNKGMPGSDIDPGKSSGGPGDVWRSFFYRGMDR